MTRLVLALSLVSLAGCAAAPAPAQPPPPAIDADLPIAREWSGLSFKIDPNIDPGVISSQADWEAFHERLDLHPIPPVDWTTSFVLRYVTVVYDPGPSEARIKAIRVAPQSGDIELVIEESIVLPMPGEEPAQFGTAYHLVELEKRAVKQGASVRFRWENRVRSLDR